MTTTHQAAHVAVLEAMRLRMEFSGDFSSEAKRPARLAALDAAIAALTASPQATPEGDPAHREFLGQIVRMEWVKWAREQPNPKPSWLTPWRDLTEPEREVDRRIGERIYRMAIGALYDSPQVQGGEDNDDVRWALNGLPALANNLHAEGQTSRADVIRRTCRLIRRLATPQRAPGAAIGEIDLYGHIKWHTPSGLMPSSGTKLYTTTSRQTVSEATLARWRTQIDYAPCVVQKEITSALAALAAPVSAVGVDGWNAVDDVLASLQGLAYAINNENDCPLKLSAEMLTVIQRARSPRTGLRAALASGPSGVDDNPQCRVLKGVGCEYPDCDCPRIAATPAAQDQGEGK
jgi:hypothetical protein